MYSSKFWKNVETDRKCGMTVEQVCNKHNIQPATLRRARLAGKLNDNTRLSTIDAQNLRNKIKNMELDKLKQIFEENNKSVAATLTYLGLTQSRTNRNCLKDQLKKIGVQSKRIVGKTTYTKERFVEACSVVNNLTELTYELGLSVHSYNNQTFKRLIKEYDVDVNHWELNKKQRKYSFDEMFCKNSKLARTGLKHKVLQYGVLPLDKCDECGISEWNGKRLSIQIDHIDGDCRNNEVNNLRGLCPNCHSLTDTYCGKTRK